jgi:hypothetical protein
MEASASARAAVSAACDRVSCSRTASAASRRSRIPWRRSIAVFRSTLSLMMPMQAAIEPCMIASAGAG